MSCRADVTAGAISRTADGRVEPVPIRQDHCRVLFQNPNRFSVGVFCWVKFDFDFI